MLLPFFYELRRARLPVSVTEYLSLMEVLRAGLARNTVEDFYHLGRLCLVKDEAHYDRYDQVFAHYFQGAKELADGLFGEIPEDWLQRMAELQLSDEEKAEIEAMGGWEALMDTLKQRLEEQKERHEGGSKWIGTAGTSPYGAYGYNPEGIRIGQKGGRNRSAVKVWDRREFRNFDENVELGTRNIKVALRRLRKFARSGSVEELDLDDTIRSTAKNAGMLDIKMVPERRNAIKVLLFLDVGGTMDAHVRVCEELFSAAHSEFKHLEYFYFHNFIYERVWKDNRRRHAETTPTWDVLHRYGADYKVIFIGDATMSPYEITYPGGSVEHWNEEAGSVWMERVKRVYPKLVWLNPEPERSWHYTPSTAMTSEMVEGKMFPLTVDGLTRAMESLVS